MKTFSEFVNEGSDRDYVDNRLTTLFKKEGLAPKVKKEIGYTKYIFENDVEIINDFLREYPCIRICIINARPTRAAWINYQVTGRIWADVLHYRDIKFT